MDTPADGDDIDAIGNTEAVRLFTDRAARHSMPLAWDELTAQVVGRISRRLDGPAAQGETLPRARALAVAAHLLQQTGGYAAAGECCEEALAAAGDDYLVADLLDGHASVLLRQGQQDAALPLIELGLDLARRLEEPHLTGRLLSVRSHARYVEGDRAAAARDLVESLRFFRQAGDRLHVGGVVGNLGYLELSRGDLDSARRHLAESLDIFRELNDHYGIVNMTHNLGLAEYLTGSPGTAESLFAESFDLARRARMRSSTAYALIGLAMAGGGADLARSARLHGAADQDLTALGETIEPTEGQLRDLDCQRLSAAMGAEAFEAEFAAGRLLTSEQITDLVLGQQA